MKKLLLGLTLLSSLTGFAETQSEFIERTSSQMSFEQRIEFAITDAYKRHKNFGVDGFKNGYACQDIGKAQLAIDLALHSKMDVQVLKTIHKKVDGNTDLVMEKVDLDELSENLDSVQDQICRLDVR